MDKITIQRNGRKIKLTVTAGYGIRLTINSCPHCQVTESPYNKPGIFSKISGYSKKLFESKINYYEIVICNNCEKEIEDPEIKKVNVTTITPPKHLMDYVKNKKTYK